MFLPNFSAFFLFQDALLSVFLVILFNSIFLVSCLSQCLSHTHFQGISTFIFSSRKPSNAFQSSTKKNDKNRDDWLSFHVSLEFKRQMTQDSLFYYHIFFHHFLRRLLCPLVCQVPFLYNWMPLRLNSSWTEEIKLPKEDDSSPAD